jgi:hypothetical protein
MPRYNRQRYHTNHYNLDGEGLFQSASETVTSSETLVVSITKPLSESLTSSDALVKDSSKPLVDSIVSADSVTRQVTQKLLTENVRTNDWLSADETPKNPDFGA